MNLQEEKRHLSPNNIKIFITFIVFSLLVSCTSEVRNWTQLEIVDDQFHNLNNDDPFSGKVKIESGDSISEMGTIENGYKIGIWYHLNKEEDTTMIDYYVSGELEKKVSHNGNQQSIYYPHCCRDEYVKNELYRNDSLIITVDLLEYSDKTYGSLYTFHQKNYQEYKDNAGEVYANGKFIDDKKEGFWYESVKYENDQFNDDGEFSNEISTLYLMSGNYIKGKKEGLWKIYYKGENVDGYSDANYNGVFAEINYLNNVKHGKTVFHLHVKNLEVKNKETGWNDPSFIDAKNEIIKNAVTLWYDQNTVTKVLCAEGFISEVTLLYAKKGKLGSPLYLFYKQAGCMQRIGYRRTDLTDERWGSASYTAIDLNSDQIIRTEFSSNDYEVSSDYYEFTARLDDSRVVLGKDYSERGVKLSKSNFLEYGVPVNAICAYVSYYKKWETIFYIDIKDSFYRIFRSDSDKGLRSFSLLKNVSCSLSRSFEWEELGCENVFQCSGTNRRNQKDYGTFSIGYRIGNEQEGLWMEWKPDGSFSFGERGIDFISKKIQVGKKGVKKWKWNTTHINGDSEAGSYNDGFKQGRWYYLDYKTEQAYTTNYDEGVNNTNRYNKSEAKARANTRKYGPPTGGMNDAMKRVTDPTYCFVCKGSGREKSRLNNGQSRKCPMCDGLGKRRY